MLAALPTELLKVAWWWRPCPDLLPPPLLSPDCLELCQGGCTSQGLLFSCLPNIFCCLRGHELLKLSYQKCLTPFGLAYRACGCWLFCFSGKNTWFSMTWGSTGDSCSSWKGLVVKPHLKNIYLFFPELFPTTITTTKTCPIRDRALFEPHLLLGCQVAM